MKKIIAVLFAIILFLPFGKMAMAGDLLRELLPDKKTVRGIEDILEREEMQIEKMGLKPQFNKLKFNLKIYDYKFWSKKEWKDLNKDRQIRSYIELDGEVRYSGRAKFMIFFRRLF